MPNFSQVPGTLNLTAKRGDRFATVIDFDDISLDGYTVTSSVVSAVSGSAVESFDVDVSQGTAGKVGISIANVTTPAGSYRWSVKWDAGLSPRTALEGYFEVVP
jgi:hypothetical protein